MGKSSLPPDAAYLDRAAVWSANLTRMRARGPGDIPNAMRAIAREYGVEYGVLWSLRYRRERLRTISVSVYEAIAAAYRAECARQILKLGAEIAETEKVAGPGHPSVVAAAAVVRAAGAVNDGSYRKSGRFRPHTD